MLRLLKTLRECRHRGAARGRRHCGALVLREPGEARHSFAGWKKTLRWRINVRTRRGFLHQGSIQGVELGADFGKTLAGKLAGNGDGFHSIDKTLARRRAPVRIAVWRRRLAAEGGLVLQIRRIGEIAFCLRCNDVTEEEQRGHVGQSHQGVHDVGEVPDGVTFPD